MYKNLFYLISMVILLICFIGCSSIADVSGTYIGTSTEIASSTIQSDLRSSAPGDVKPVNLVITQVDEELTIVLNWFTGITYNATGTLSDDGTFTANGTRPSGSWAYTDTGTIDADTGLYSSTIVFTSQTGLVLTYTMELTRQ